MHLNFSTKLNKESQISYPNLISKRIYRVLHKQETANNFYKTQFSTE